MKFFSTTKRGSNTRKTLKTPENPVLENALFNMVYATAKTPYSIKFRNNFRKSSFISQ